MIIKQTTFIYLKGIRLNENNISETNETNGNTNF